MPGGRGTPSPRRPPPRGIPSISCFSRRTRIGSFFACPIPSPPAAATLWAAVVAAGIAGWLLTLTFPAISWWPMAFVAIPLALLTLIGRRVRGALWSASRSASCSSS